MGHFLKFFFTFAYLIIKLFLFIPFFWCSSSLLQRTSMRPHISSGMSTQATPVVFFFFSLYLVCVVEQDRTLERGEQFVRKESASKRARKPISLALSSFLIISFEIDISNGSKNLTFKKLANLFFFLQNLGHPGEPKETRQDKKENWARLTKDKHHALTLVCKEWS